MTFTALLQNDIDVVAGLGVDLLRDIVPGVGCNGDFAIDIEMTGCGMAIGAAATSGANRAAVGVVEQTGSSRDETALLCGASGVDTLAGLDGGDLGTTGGNALTRAPALADIGCSTVVDTVGHEVFGTPSRDLSIAFILDRIAAFSPMAPVSVGFRMGYAR